MNKAIFFDRDGIVNIRIKGDYVKSVDEFTFEHFFFQLFELIKKQNYLAILVTNQQCINKGIITADKLSKIHTYMQAELLKHANYQFDDINFCPDLEGTGSKYRKPATGMFDDAVKKYDIDVTASWTIGDAITDIQAGRKVGTKTIFVNRDASGTDKINADFTYTDLFQVYNHFSVL